MPVLKIVKIFSNKLIESSKLRPIKLAGINNIKIINDHSFIGVENLFYQSLGNETLNQSYFQKILRIFLTILHIINDFLRNIKKCIFFF